MSTSTIRTRTLRLLAVGGLLGAVWLPSAASAQDVGVYGNGNAGGGGGVSPGGSQVTPTGGGGGALPFTGGDVVGLALIGLGAVTGGTVLARSGRRKVAGA